MAITPIHRITYAHIAEPSEDQNGRLFYSCGFLIEKTDTAALAWWKNEIEKAAQRGVELGKFPAKAPRTSAFKNPLRDGDEYLDLATDEKQKASRACYAGHYFVNVKSPDAPGVVDKACRPFPPEKVYSGCYGRGDVRFNPYNNQSMGVSVYIDNFMFCADGEKFGISKQDATTAFAGVAECVDESGEVQPSESQYV